MSLNSGDCSVDIAVYYCWYCHGNLICRALGTVIEIQSVIMHENVVKIELQTVKVKSYNTLQYIDR